MQHRRKRSVAVAIYRFRKISTISGSRQTLLQAHFIEYQATVAKIGRFESLQLIIWGVLFAFVTLAASIVHQAQLIWVSVIAAQIVVAIYYFALYEAYSHTRYIECDLRPKVAGLLHTDLVWRCEKYIRRKGKSLSPLIGDIFFPLSVSFIAVLVPIWWTWCHELSKLSFALCMYTKRVCICVAMLGIHKGGKCTEGIPACCITRRSKWTPIPLRSIGAL